MSKQYLTAQVIEDAHLADIFALAVTPTYIITASGDSSIKLWNTISPDHKLVHQFPVAHRLGAHHVVVSQEGQIAASAGFAGEIIIWDLNKLTRLHEISPSKDPGGIWALALSRQGDMLACSTCDGKVNIWDLKTEAPSIARQYGTKGSFGMCVDISPDGTLVASGHENGGIYMFNNETGRMHHSLHGIVKPVRSVRFSPFGKLLAAAGDANVVALFDVVSGEQVANLIGHTSWIFSLAWNFTGEHLVSVSFDGKAKVWSTETRTCVATHSESGGSLYAVQWMPKLPTTSEGFITGGASRTLCFYREASGE